MEMGGVEMTQSFQAWVTGRIGMSTVKSEDHNSRS